VPRLTDQGVCLRQWDYSETSQTVALFCREHGVLRGLAKGSRRDKAPFSGGIEAVTRGHVAAIVKSGPQLATVTEWDLADPYFGVRRTLSAFHVGAFTVDLVYHAFTEADPHPALFDALDRTLCALGEGDERDLALLLGFEWTLLDEAGYRPELSRDVAGADPLTDAETLGFSPRFGGVTRDPGTVPHDPNATVWRVRGSTIDLLRRVAAGGEIGSATPESVRRAAQLLAAYLREVLRREPPSMRALFGADGVGSARGG